MSDAGAPPRCEDVPARQLQAGDRVLFAGYTCIVRWVQPDRNLVRMSLAKLAVGQIEEDWFQPLYSAGEMMRRIVR